MWLAVVLASASVQLVLGDHLQNMFKLDVPPQTGPFTEQQQENTLDRDMQLGPLGGVHVHLGDQLLHHVFIHI